MSDDIKKKFGGVKALAIAAVLLVAAIIAISFIFDANQFRPEIESRLTSALGRRVNVGNLKLSLLSSSVAADDITIADDPAFSPLPFVDAKSFQIGVELKPLIFSKAIRITAISLDGPAITLIRSTSGKWNFSDLGGKSPTDKSESAGKESHSLSGMDIFIRQLRITNGQVTVIRGEEAQKPFTYDQVRFVASNLSFDSDFPFTLTASLPGDGKIELEGQAGPINRTDAFLTPVAAALAATHFNLVSSGFVAPDSGIGGLIDFSGNLDSNGRLLQSKGNARVDKLQLVKAGSPAAQPVSLQYAVNYDLTSQTGTINEANAAYGNAIAHLNGHYNMRGNSLHLMMRMQGTEMPVQDLKTLLPAFGVILPKGASLEGGVLNADLTTEGSIEKMTTTGTAEISNTRLSGFDLAGKMAALTSPGQIKSISVTEIQKLASSMRLTPERIQVSNLILIAPALGELSGEGTISPDQSLDFKMQALLKPSGSLGYLVKGSKLNVPFFVRGFASDPKFVPDVTGAAGSLLESVLSEQSVKEEQPGSGQTLGDALRDLLQKKKR